MRRLIALSLLMAVAGPAAARPCLKADCSQDPQAWADMFGTAPAQRREQQIVRRAAAAEVERRKLARDIGASYGEQDRYRLVLQLEDSFTRITNEPYTVVDAVMIPNGSHYLFCGTGVHRSGAGIFVFDTDPRGIHTLTASKAQFDAAGCADPVGIRLH